MLSVTNCKIYGLDDSMQAIGLSYGTVLSHDKSLNIANKLGHMPSNSGEDNFLSGIIAQFDLKCSNKMWIEMERYHFMQIVMSQSTMHSLKKMISPKEDPYNKFVDPEIKRIMQKLSLKYSENPTSDNYLSLLYSNPCGCEIKARVTTNYRQLKTIYQQRHNHKLPEWRQFCDLLIDKEDTMFPLFRKMCLEVK